MPSQADFEAAFNASRGRMGTPADLMALSNMRIGNSASPSGWIQEWDANQTKSQSATGKHALVRQPIKISLTYCPDFYKAISSPLAHLPMNQPMHATFSTGFYMPSMVSQPEMMAGKGKGKSQDAEFEAAFARFEEISQEKEQEGDSTGTTDMDA